MDIKTLRQIIRDESPSRIMLGEVISNDPRGTRTASVRVSGGRVHTRVFTCDESIEIGDKVIVVRLMGLDQLAVLGKLVSQHGSNLSKRGVLAPPDNFGAYSFAGVTYCQWDTYPGEDVSWEVQHALQADKSDAASVLVSRGSYYFYETDPGTTVYFRARAIRWLGPNNLMYSGWSSWAGVTCDEYEVPNLLVELTNQAGKQVGADWVVVIDTGNASSFTTTTVAGDEDVIGVAHETIEDGDTGLVCISGQHNVYVAGAPGIGDYLTASATEGRADGAAAASPGCFGRSLTTKDADDKVTALIGPAGGAGSGMLAHNLLSAWHGDTVAANVVRGDLPVGNATPAWARLARGAADEAFRMNAAGTDPIWGELPISTLDNYARGAIMRSGAIDWEAYAAETDAQILVGDGTDINSVPVSQDATLTNAGAVTVTGIQARAVNAAAPADGQVYAWVDAVSEWQPQDPGGGGGAPVFRVDGTLTATTKVNEAYVSTGTAEIGTVYIHCGTQGTAGSTIVDVNKNGVTIFTVQANRPTLAWNDADGVAKSGDPDVTTLAENDVLTVDIDQVATGAEDLSVVISMGALGSYTFLNLTDTPGAYAGEGGKRVAINAAEDALEFDGDIGVWELISETVLTGNAASVTFTSIPQGYRHLVLVFSARTDRAAEEDQIDVRLNGDAGANYDWLQIKGDVGVGVATSGARAASSMRLASCEGANSAANGFTGGHIQFDYYATADRLKTGYGPGSGIFGDVNADTDLHLKIRYGHRRNAAATTAIALFPQTGLNFVAGSRFTLYGVL